MRKNYKQMNLLDWLKHAEMVRSGRLEALCNDCHKITDRYTVIMGETYHLDVDECIRENETLIPLLEEK